MMNRNGCFKAVSTKTIILFSGLMILISCKNNSGSDNDKVGELPSYPVKIMSYQETYLENNYSATVKGIIDMEVKPRVTGIIKEMYIDEGAYVHCGQKLFRIDAPETTQELETAKAAYNTALLDVNRIRPLAQKGIISHVQLETYENSLKAAVAAMQKAKASISWATITSPVDGVVGTINYRQGSLVNSTTVLTTVSDIKKVVAYFSMNEKDLFSFLNEANGKNQAAKIKNMPKVSLILADGSLYNQKGTISTISGIIDNSGAAAFRATFPNNEDLLRSGVSAKIVIPHHLKNIFLIPQNITFNQQDKTFVFVYDGEKVVQKSIEVKSTPDGQNFAVISGLHPGDNVVTDGIAQLSNGMKIKVRL